MCLFFFFTPGYVALWDSKTPHRPAGERVSCCLETSPSRLPPQDLSLSLTLLSLFLSFIFCPTSFWREWAAFLSVWCLLPAFRSCFVEVAQLSNDLLMNLWGRKWSPQPIPPPSWDPVHWLLKWLLIGMYLLPFYYLFLCFCSLLFSSFSFSSCSLMTFFSYFIFFCIHFLCLL